ncbi:MAG: YcaO-like family protein [Pseudomonadota bacterium]
MTLAGVQTHRPGGTAKTHWRGTHRVVCPEETLARLLPHLPAMGITRVGMLTGLDRLGLPVAVAVRPNGRAISVAQGKGVTPAAAKVSAIMEAAETFHAETVTGPLHYGTAAEVTHAVDPERLPVAANGPGRDRAVGDPRLWIPGEDLATGRERLVPFELVHARYALPAPEPVCFQATTSGLAAGNVAVEAQLHALYEAIERDAIACWRSKGGPAKAGTALNLSTVEDPDLHGLMDGIAQADVDLVAWDLTSDAEVPVMIAMLIPRAGERGGVEAELGSGCHLDPSVALSRAITEAAQTRLTRISGARDDFDPQSYSTEARRRRRVEAQSWLTLGRRGRVAWTRAITQRWQPSADLEADLGAVLDALASIGCGEAVWIDLTRPEIGIPVGRVVVPGLEGPWLPGLYSPGARAKAAHP